jgi:hypothetical protein
MGVSNLKYYKLSQCKHETNVIHVPNIDVKELENSLGFVRQIKESENSIFLNYYEKPIPIVSDKLKKTIQLHQPDAIRQPLALANMHTKFFLQYWALNLSTIDYRNEKSIVLKKEDIENKKIFKVKLGATEHVIINLDLAESMLLTLNVDIELEEVEVNG